MVLLRQWFSTVLRPYEHLTLRVVGEDGMLHHQAFQFLDLERHNMIVRPFMDKDQQAEEEGLYTVTMQPLQLWRQGDLQQLPETLDAFAVDDPLKVDIITAVGVSDDCRQGIVAWKARQSDVEGCVELHAKEPLLARPVNFMCKKVPVLSLLDELHSRGFVGVEEVVNHTADVAHYDRRRASGRRPYFQCVLHMDALAKKGVLSFHSVGSNAYFEALLRGKGQVRTGLPALEYRRMLASEGGDDLAVASLAVANRPKRKRAPPKAGAKTRAKAKASRRSPQLALEAGPQALADEDSSEGSVFGGSAPSIPEAAGPEGNGHGAPSEQASVAGPAASVAASRRSRFVMPPGIPAQILGSSVLFVAGRISDTHTYHDRLTIRCTNPAHAKCAKSRSLVLMKKKYGVRCAEAFLGAWLMKAESMDGKAHGKFAPTVSDMDEYLAAHP